MQEESKNQIPTNPSFNREEKPSKIFTQLLNLKEPSTGFSRGSDFVKNKETEQPAPKESKSDGNKFLRNQNPTPTTQSSGGPPKFSSGIKRNETVSQSNSNPSPLIQTKSEPKPVSNSSSNESPTKTTSTNNSGGGWRNNAKK
jgi:hypothetical protein